MYLSPFVEVFDIVREGRNEDLIEFIDIHPSVIEARDNRRNTPLILATYLNNPEATKILVEAGADLNVAGGTGTALMGVCFKGFADIAGYLLEAGADVNTVAVNNSTALHFAAMFNQAEIVELLIQAGADAGAKDVDGLTAADHARKRGLDGIADKLG